MADIASAMNQFPPISSRFENLGETGLLPLSNLPLVSDHSLMYPRPTWVKTGVGMARSIHRLSPAAVKHAKPGMYCDGGGLYLQAVPGAGGIVRKSWLFRFAENGRERQMGLGSLDN